MLILPYLGLKEVYDRYDFKEPWDGPHNRAMVSARPEVFACRSDMLSPSSPTMTNYVAIVGTTTAWPGAGRSALADIKSGGQKHHLGGRGWGEAGNLLVAAGRYFPGPVRESLDCAIRRWQRKQSCLLRQARECDLARWCPRRIR